MVGSEKTFFSTQKIEKNFLNIFENLVENIVCHAEMHVCAKYGKISTKYGMDIAIDLVIRIESQDKSYIGAKITYKEARVACGGHGSITGRHSRGYPWDIGSPFYSILVISVTFLSHQLSTSHWWLYMDPLVDLPKNLVV